MLLKANKKHKMKNYNYILGLSIIATTLFSCGNGDDKADGYGNFEATEITISAENNGKLMQFIVNEGDIVKKEAFLGYIDTIPLTLKREQLQVSKAVISSKSKGVLSQISVLKSKLKTAKTNKMRAENLLKDNAGTQKQLDAILSNKKVKSLSADKIKAISTVPLNVYVDGKQIMDKIPDPKGDSEGTVKDKRMLKPYFNLNVILKKKVNIIKVLVIIEHGILLPLVTFLYMLVVVMN